MLLRKTIHKTKMFFHKTLQNLKSFLFGEYQKLPKPRPLKPVYGGNDSNPNVQQLDELYRDFSEQWQSHNDDKVMKSKEPMNEADTSSSGSFMKFEERSALKNRHEEREKEKKKTGSSGAGKRGEACSQIGNGGGGYMLAQKMRELEMMDMNDAEHVLDMEEVLHHYSRLTCPVYLDLVDTFFMDMYSEFFIPKPSAASITNSSQRLRPLKF